MALDLPAAIAALNDPSTRLATIEALGASGDFQATGALLTALGSHRGEVRAAAARALGQLGDRAASTALSARSSADPFGAVAVWSVLALEKLGIVALTPVPLASAPRTREGARYWGARLAYDFRTPELRATARDALDELGPDAIDGLVDTMIANPSFDVESTGLRATVERVLLGRVVSGSPAESSAAVRCLLRRSEAWAQEALERAVRVEADVPRRESILDGIAVHTELEWTRGFLERVLDGEDGSLARLAARALARRGLPAPHAPPSITSAPETRHALPFPLNAAGLFALARAMAERLGYGGAPVIESTTEALPPRRVGNLRSVHTTRWVVGPVTATHVVDGEEHPHEGGGAIESATIAVDEGVISLVHVLERYTVGGPDGERVETLMLRTIEELGWAATRGLSWAGGTITLDTSRARVSFTSSSGEPRWHADLDASQGILGYLAARAEVVAGRLFVLTECEHGHAGGGPYLFRLHRVREDGTVAWMRTLDLLERPHRLRWRDGSLEVFAAWTTALTQVAVPARWTLLDPETGISR